MFLSSTEWDQCYPALPNSPCSPRPRSSRSALHPSPRKPPPPPSRYSRETLVDVTVTDAKGRPVRGLRRSDFTVEEDGKPQSIRSLREFSKDAHAATTATPQLPPHTYTNFQPSTGPLTVLLFDDINDGDIAQARRGAENFIKSKASDAQVAMLALGQRLTILQGPTSDAAMLLKKTNIYVEPYQVEARGCSRQIVLDWATLEQLNQVATYLSGIKGRKNLIWIGNGIPDMIWLPPDSCQNWIKPLRKTYDLLEDAQVTVYPVDPNGVREMNPSVQRNLLSMEAVAEATGGVAYYERNDLDTLISRAAESGAVYYTLSYVPPSPAYDGKYHAITINVNRPDVHLIYRKGYSAEDPAQITHPPETLLGVKTRETLPAGALANPLVSAMAPVVPPATQLLFNVRADVTTEPPMPFDPPIIGALNPKLNKAPLTRYDFLFTLPQDQIAFADAGAGTFSGAVEFDLAAYDTDGRLVTMRSQTLKLPLTNDEYRQFIQTPFQFLQQLDLPPGQFTLRTGAAARAEVCAGLAGIVCCASAKLPSADIAGTASSVCVAAFKKLRRSIRTRVIAGHPREGEFIREITVSEECNAAVSPKGTASAVP